MITGKQKASSHDNIFLNINLKRDISPINLLALPYISFFTTNLVGFFNTQMIFMLRDPESFNVPENQIGLLTAQVLLVAQLITLSIHPSFGYAYDLFGRKLIVVGSAALLVGTVYVFPVTSPSITLLKCVYTFGFILRCLKEANPLLIDYVKSESRGRAAGMRLLGTFFGEIFCQAFLVGLTSKMSFKASFHLVSIILLVMVVPMFWMVKES